MTPQPTTDDSMQQSNHSNGSKTVVIPIHAVTTSKTVAANEETVDDVDEHEDDIPEWTMLELNGELLPPIAVQQHNHNAKENEFHPILGPDGIELGSLQFLNKTTPILIVGSHELKGSIQTLSNPFAVLEKVREPPSNHNDASTEHEDSGIAYRLVGMVKQKILFQSYPKSILRY